MLASPWFKFAVAIVLGLLIGLERERSKGEGPSRRAAGIRTFALATLLGAVAAYLGGTLLLVATTAAVAVLAALSYVRGHDGDPGLTTAIGLVVAPLLGGLVMSDALLASGLAVVVAVLFAVKAPLHQFVKGILTDAELTDGFILAIATLVIWPQLPNRYLGPFDAVNPHSLWLLVILILAIGAIGHIATRILGTRYGLPIAGFASGFVSSTATIASMAGQAARTPAALNAAVAGAALSTVATFVQMALLLFAVNAPTFKAMAPALAAGGLVAAGYALIFALRPVQTEDLSTSDDSRSLSLKAAFIIATTMAVAFVITAYLKNAFGETGVVIGAALAGFVDTHAGAISVASLVASGTMDPHAAPWPILTAMSTNVVTKLIASGAVGFGRFPRRLIPGLLLSIAAAWAAAILLA